MGEVTKKATKTKATKKKATKKKATKKKAKIELPKELVLSLFDPAFTDQLRAGLGGLAASLYAIAEEDSGSSWPDKILLGPGHACVTPEQITLDFAGEHEATLEALFKKSFRLTKEGMIDLFGAYPRRTLADPKLLSELQWGLKRTFLQHGTTTSGKKDVTLSFEVDDKKVHLESCAFESYLHHDRNAAEILKALKTKAISLAGWAYPGAAQRHVAFGKTKAEYTAAEALTACFGLVGCLSLKGPGKTGVLVMPGVTDLLLFAKVRRKLTPKKFRDCSVAGEGDGVLLLAATLKTLPAEERDGCGHFESTILTPMPWCNKQKYRADKISSLAISENTLDAFYEASHHFANRVVVLNKKRKADKEHPCFIATSHVREFVATNIARGARWYTGFAVAKAKDNSGKLIHRNWHDDLGVMSVSDKKGITKMTEDLLKREAVLVQSVQLALKHRFGAIASENVGNNQAMKNRMQAERDKWRLAFAGAKTQQQIRAALADLWSRAAPNAVLQENWADVLPLLRHDQWQSARDLALIALASYKSSKKPEEKEGE